MESFPSPSEQRTRNRDGVVRKEYGGKGNQGEGEERGEENIGVGESRCCEPRKVAREHALARVSTIARQAESDH